MQFNALACFSVLVRKSPAIYAHGFYVMIVGRTGRVGLRPQVLSYLVSEYTTGVYGRRDYEW